MRANAVLEMRDRDGRVVATRQASNAVLRTGAELVAGLFSGRGGGITHMGVGTSDAPEGDPFTTDALQNEAVGEVPALTGGVDAAIPAEAFQIAVDAERRVVRVRVRATLPEDTAVGVIREAALLSRTGEETVLYNRITFTPMTKGDDHELTLFWEVSFPYGDLQWVM